MTKKLTDHSMEEVKSIIGSKADLYEAAVRNGWYMPKYKSSIITEDYITNVITGKLFCPRYEEIRLSPCPKPPDKQVLLKDFTKLVLSERKISGIDEAHTPDKNWLLTVLGTYNPVLPYFQKSYVPPPKTTQASAVTKVQLPENFLHGLPISKRKVKVRRLNLLAQSKEDGKLKRLKMLKEKFSADFLKEKNRLDARKHKLRNANEQQLNLNSRSHHESPQPTHRERDALADSMMNLSMNQPQASRSQSATAKENQQPMSGVSLKQVQQIPAPGTFTQVVFNNGK